MKEINKPPTVEPLVLDATDLKLLDALQTDASLSNQALSARVNTSPPTCLRRVKRLQALGLIDRQVALLNPDKLAAALGHGLTAIIEITLDQQGAEWLAAFEQRVAPVLQPLQALHQDGNDVLRRDRRHDAAHKKAFV